MGHTPKGWLLLDFAVQGITPKIRIILLQLKALGRIALVFHRGVSAHAGNTRFALLSALEVDHQSGLVFFLGHGFPLDESPERTVQGIATDNP